MSLLVVAQAFAEVGKAISGMAMQARSAGRDVAESARSSSGGIQNARTGTPTSMSATDLGDPRNAEEQAARMIASIEAAKRR